MSADDVQWICLDVNAIHPRSASGVAGLEGAAAVNPRPTAILDRLAALPGWPGMD